MKTFKANSGPLANGKWAPHGSIHEVVSRSPLMTTDSTVWPTAEIFDSKEEADKVFTDYCLQQRWQEKK